MSANSEHTDSAGTTTLPRPAQLDAAGSQPAQPERACCCSARPMMIAMIPPGEGLAAVDLWLCGHHYRKSQQALTAAGAAVAAALGAIDR